MRFLLIFGLLAPLLPASPVAAQEPAVRPATISVSGAGEAMLKPDFARILVAVGTTGESVTQAVEANRSASERVLARLQALGIKREDIQTANFQVVQTPPRRGPDGNEIKVPKYTANHVLRLTSHDLDGIGRLAGEILAVGDMTFQSLSWGLDRQDEGEDQARRNAVADARRQAETYAGAAGLRLGRLVEIRDGTVQALDMGFADLPTRMNAAAAAPPVPIVPPANLRYTASVQITWELAPSSP